MIIDDGTILGVISVLGTVIASVAGAVTWMTKRHLTLLSETVKGQALHIKECDEHIKECDDDREKMKAEKILQDDAHARLKHRTEVLELAVDLTSRCTYSDCPNKQLLKSTTSKQFIRPA